MKKLVALALFLVVCFGWFVAPLVADGDDPVPPGATKSATLPGDDSKTNDPIMSPVGDDETGLVEVIIDGLGLDPIIEIALVVLIEG
ncbi:MAG: hypothetical protein GYA46_05595 [candidate division Zixibacteria bacterium]|nr:hypothetical protein [candidate division Zixibacteria bacterium]